MNLPLKVPLQKVTDSLLEEKCLDVFIKREDLIHDLISGNKWRKLHYNLEEAAAKKYAAEKEAAEKEAAEKKYAAEKEAAEKKYAAEKEAAEKKYAAEKEAALKKEEAKKREKEMAKK